MSKDQMTFCTRQRELVERVHTTSVLHARSSNYDLNINIFGTRKNVYAAREAFTLRRAASIQPAYSIMGSATTQEC